MMKKLGAAASIFAIIAMSCIPSYAEEMFKNSDFLKWSEENRSFYIRTSVGMAGLIASKNDVQHANCLEKWYFSDEQTRLETIYGYMREFQDAHPRAIIMAVLKKQCGSFQYVDSEG